MFANIFTAITSSTAITLALLYLMNALIGIQPHALVEVRDPATINWVRVPEKEDPPDTIEHLPKRKDLKPPEVPTVKPTGNPGESYTIKVPHTAPTPTNRFTNFKPGLSDGQPMPIVRVRPVYPARAQTSGLEGWVLVRFDILENGSVANVTVVESSSAVFERSAINAASKFRYKPRVVDGVPLVTTGIQNLFRYEMEK